MKLKKPNNLVHVDVKKVVGCVRLEFRTGFLEIQKAGESSA